MVLERAAALNPAMKATSGFAGNFPIFAPDLEPQIANTRIEYVLTSTQPSPGPRAVISRSPFREIGFPSWMVVDAVYRGSHWSYEATGQSGGATRRRA
jgi:hypothetical protein